MKLALTELPHALKKAGYKPVPYRTTYEAARSAKISVDRCENGRWAWDFSDLDQIANELGLRKNAA